MLTRRTALATALAAAAGPTPLSAATPILVYKTPECGCCGGWATAMRRAGFSVNIEAVADILPILTRRGVPEHLASCHVATVGPYVVVGHAPARDIRAMLDRRPRAIGIAVPGMPAGSPGMERSDGKSAAYDVLLVGFDGKVSLFRRQG